MYEFVDMYFNKANFFIFANLFGAILIGWLIGFVAFLLKKY